MIQREKKVTKNKKIWELQQLNNLKIAKAKLGLIQQKYKIFKFKMTSETELESELEVYEMYFLQACNF